MQPRRHIEQTTSLKERIAAETQRLGEKARLLPPGIARERAIGKARQAETGLHINEWLRSPGLRAPT